MYCQLSVKVSHWVWILKQQFIVTCLTWCHTEPNFEAIVCSDLSVKIYITDPESYRNSLLWPVSKDISHWASIISNSSQWPVSENISLILNLEAVVYRNLSTNSSHSVFKRQAYSDLSTKSSYWVWVFKRQLYSDLSTRSSHWVWVFKRQAYSDLSTKSSHWAWVFKRQLYSDLSTKSSYWVWVLKRQLYSDLSTKSSYWVWVFMRQAYSDLSTKSSYWVWVSLTLGVQLSPLM